DRRERNLAMTTETNTSPRVRDADPRERVRRLFDSERSLGMKAGHLRERVREADEERAGAILRAELGESESDPVIAPDGLSRELQATLRAIEVSRNERCEAIRAVFAAEAEAARLPLRNAIAVRDRLKEQMA